MALHVEETGTPVAPSILFLHGIGTSGWMWKRQVAALSDFHCLNVDLPGHGKSNHIPWLSLTDTADRVADAIRQHAPAGRAHIVGLSLGAHIALVLLERHADVAERVVISGVTAEPWPNRAFLNPQLWLTTALLQRRWFMKRLMNSARVPADMRADFVENLLAISMRTFRRIYREAATFHAPRALRGIPNPTLITAGGNEAKIITRAVGEIVAMIPNAQGRLAPGQGHGWNVQAPDLFNAMIRAWLTGAPLPAGLVPVD